HAPELALGHRNHRVQRLRRHDVRRILLLDGKMPCLRPVAVGDDGAVPRGDKVRDHRGHLAGMEALLLVASGLAVGTDGVAAEGQHRGRPGFGAHHPATTSSWGLLKLFVGSTWALLGALPAGSAWVRDGAAPDIYSSLRNVVLI